MHQLPNFIYESPTAWHAVENLCKTFKKNGFTILNETDEWTLKPGKAYAIVRNGSSLIAFVAPKKKPSSAILCASHTDSPALKLKPNAAFIKDQMLFLGADLYGSPLLSSWLNRDLGIAGRVVTLDKTGQAASKLVNVTSAPVVIPQLAIHLDREVNTKGLVINKQEHLAALVSAEYKSEKKAENFLNTLLKIDPILSADLFLYPIEPPSILGESQDLLAGYRLDSLESVHAIASAFIKTAPSSHTIKMCAFWDNEEIGSETAYGAASPFFAESLERIVLSMGCTRLDYLRLIASSLCVSVDLAHGYHPGFSDKYEPKHRCYLGKGVVIKHSSQNKYASDAHTVGHVKALCKKHHIPFQDAINRADIPSGSTIGPIHANNTGMATVDIGIPQLSMHSSREIVSMKDHESLVELLAEFYTSAR